MEKEEVVERWVARGEWKRKEPIMIEVKFFFFIVVLIALVVIEMEI